MGILMLKISSVVDVERIAEELGKKFEIVPKKSSPKKKKKATHKTNKNASTKATPVAKKRKMTPAQKKAMEHDEDEEDIEHVQNEEEMVHVQHEDEKEHDEVLKAIPTKRKRTQTIAVERRNQPYRETKGKDHSWKKVLTKKPRMGKMKADMLSHPEDIMRDLVKHKPTYSTDDENMEDVDPEKEYLVTMEKLTVITKLDLKRTGEESSKSPRKDCPSSPSEVQYAGDFIMSSRLPDKKVAVDTDEKVDDDEEDVVDDKVLELFNSDSEDVIKRGAVEDEIEVLIAKKTEKEVDPLFIPIQKKREIERKTVETRRRKLLDHLDLMVGRDCDQQIKLTMTDAICKRTTVSGNHWILLAFSFPEKTVRIYDLLGFKRATKEQIGVERMLPYVVYAVDPSNENIEFDFKWKRIFVPCTKQENSSSCGAYMLTMVDCLLRNKSLKFRARNEFLRRRIAMDLLDCGVKPPQKPKAEELLKVVTEEVQLEIEI
ncbi:hypothetical protein FRX31_005413 [Thalictrum thalictroides]|uniref:Ubiquitin-like protease family profile domain-containing protein n=1 Tax=Thalictrum thalictroides TaxID=46969 RepID=A0A7J6X930_THATH|nr:hypothetical protein FRX31_005413 [Thalictrum thalictroides]